MPLLRDLAIGHYVAGIHDPRVERTKDHALLDIIIIAICAVICGADSWLTTILALPNGMPSHDTFTRKRVPGVFARIDPAQFQHSFAAWVQALQQVRADLIAIDSKTHRRSHDRPSCQTAFQRFIGGAVTQPSQLFRSDSANRQSRVCKGRQQMRQGTR